MKKKIVCAWLGTFPEKEVLYEEYVAFNYEDKENGLSPFAKDAGLGWYDDDFIESWWVEPLTVEHLLQYRDVLLDQEYFFEELIARLKTMDLSNRHSITFLFGEDGPDGMNEDLFHYTAPDTSGKPIQFVFSKTYEAY